MNTFKKIEAASNSELLNMDEKTLSLIAAISGHDINIGYAPLVGNYMRFDGRDVAENEPKHPDIEFSYEKRESGEIIRIHIGSKYHGPLMGWSEDGWSNRYSHGNFGKNGSCGGTWSASSREFYPTMLQALENRFYMVGEIKMHKNRLTEGPAIIEALYTVAQTEV